MAFKKFSTHKATSIKFEKVLKAMKKNKYTVVRTYQRYKLNKNHLLVDNKRLLKRIAILEGELAEKGAVIEQLKRELDQGVIDNTEQQLHYKRRVEREVETRVQHVRVGTGRPRRS